MEIEHCYFPDNLLYDPENNTWVNVGHREVRVGITSLLAALVGRFVSFRPKDLGTVVSRRSSLGTLESQKFVGPVPSPLTGQLLETNLRVSQNPKVLNNSPYFEGWIAKLRPTRLEDEAPLLLSSQDSKNIFKREIDAYHVRCFKLFPDQELYEIGVECSAVIVKLNEAFSALDLGAVVHLVSDDPTALVEMVRWTELTGQTLVEWRGEGNLTHFIVRKDHA